MRAALAISVMALLGCQSAVRAVAWPEADALFHRDPRWLGGDAAYSVPLGGDRVLWLFGDSFVAPDGGTRENARMVHNTVALQNGLEPTQAQMQWSWRSDAGVPESFFPEEGDAWFWPFSGARVGAHVVLPLARVRPATGGLGFEGAGAKLLLVDNPDSPPAEWTMRECAFPVLTFGGSFGTGAMLTEGDWLYWYIVREPGNHDVFLARVPLAQADACDLSALAWWTGTWTPMAELKGAPSVVMPEGQTEFSVSRDSSTGRFVQVQTLGFGHTDIGRREALHPEGPWSAPTVIFHPPESDRDDAFVYAAKAHPELAGGSLVITWASNATDFWQLFLDSSLYWPRVARVP